MFVCPFVSIDVSNSTRFYVYTQETSMGKEDSIALLVDMLSHCTKQPFPVIVIVVIVD